MLDKNRDKQISLEEINALNEDEVRLASQLFPMFSLEEEEEYDEELFGEDLKGRNENEDLPGAGSGKKKTEL